MLAQPSFAIFAQRNRDPQKEPPVQRQADRNASVSRGLRAVWDLRFGGLSGPALAAGAFRAICLRLRPGLAYTYDGPRQPNGDFLENLKITENLRFLRFFGPCGNYGKITEHLWKTTEIMQKLRKKYKFLQFPSIFRNFRLIFADFENSEFGKFLLIFR